MSAPLPPLAELRALIDSVDDRLLDLMIERMAVVARIAAAKRRADGDGPALRPAREAQVLRRLVAAAGGRFPADSLVRIWRELLAAATRAQTPLTAAVCSEPCRLREIARDHLGSITPLVTAESPGHALRLLEEGRAQLAVLPLPEADARWWCDLATAERAPCAVIGRLPFLLGEGAPDTEGLLLGPVPLEASGADRSLFVLRVAGEISRSRLLEGFGRAGLEPRILAVRTEPDGTSWLLDLAGFLDEHASAVVNAAAPLRHRLLRLRRIGAYPVPLVAGDPDDRAAHETRTRQRDAE